MDDRDGRGVGRAGGVAAVVAVDLGGRELVGVDVGGTEAFLSTETWSESG